MLKTRGIIFKLTRYRESSLIFDVFTEEAGLQTFIANGVYNKSQQRLAAALQPMHLIELVAYFKEHQEMHRFKELSRWLPYQRIPYDIRRTAIGTFMLEISRKAIRTQQVNAPLFSFVETSFRHLDEVSKLHPDQHLKYMVDLSTYLGFQPNPNHSTRQPCFDLANGMFVPHQDLANEYVLSPESSTVLSKMLNPATHPMETLHLAERRQLLQQLILYYQLHIEHFGKIKSIDVFRDILE